MLLRKPKAATRSKREETPSEIAFLPYEILLAIIELLNERSVACLLQTCRGIREVAEPVLYRHIRVPGDGECSLKPYILHRTLVGRLDLLPCILSYHGPLIPVVKPPDADERSAARWREMKGTTECNTLKSDFFFGEYIEKARIIFSGAINIQELYFTAGVLQTMAQVLGVFDAPQSKVMNVRKLVLNVERYSPALVAILRTMPGLKHLDLPRLRGGEVQLDETDLPELESLKADLQRAARIVPGRPIKKLELVGDWRPDQNQLWQQLTLSTCEITEFTTEFAGLRLDGAGAGKPENLRAVARHLPRIQRLCFQITRSMSDRVLAKVLPAFTSLSHLKLLGEISEERFYFPVDDETQYGYTLENFGPFVRRLKEHCPSLVEVEWSLTATYTCCDWENESTFTYRATQ